MRAWIIRDGRGEYASAPWRSDQYTDVSAWNDFLRCNDSTCATVEDFNETVFQLRKQGYVACEVEIREVGK